MGLEREVETMNKVLDEHLSHLANLGHIRDLLEDLTQEVIAVKEELATLRHIRTRESFERKKYHEPHDK